MKYVTFTSIGSLELCENYLLSARTVGIEENIIVYCLDSESLGKLQNYNCELRSFDIPVTEEFHEYGKPQFRKVTETKIQIIINALQNMESIVYTDCDMVFRHDPTELILKADSSVSEKHDVDIFFASDSPFMDICTGFMFIKNTENVHQLFKKYFEMSNWYRIQNSEVMYDQEIIYRMLMENIVPLNYGVYPTSFIKNGHQYWNEPEKRTGNESVIHVNFTIGKEQKTNRLKEANLWYIQEEVKL